MTKLSTLAFEIGTEEIPAFDLQKATKQLASLVPEALDAVRIPHGTIRIYTSPRRLIALVSDVADQTEALKEEFRGPSVKIAFDDEGNPTKAATGFARGKGLDVSALERREENGTEYVYAVREVPATSVVALLPAALRGIIDGISWPKSCRWGTTREWFSRPVRWLVALLGDQVIPVEFAGLVGGNQTYGHRFLAPGPHQVDTADDLLSVVRDAYVVPSQEEREAVIRRGVAEVEESTGYQAELPAKTLTEVINLNEYPSVLAGTFDQEFLKVPEEIIVDAMLMHQRYFPLYDRNHRLTNAFIVVSNGNPDCSDLITEGNERVVAARLYDAKFFYEEDLKQPLESYVEHLDEVVFQETLGTMRAKTDRIVTLAEHMAARARLSVDDSAHVVRAAYLAKADLVTNAVIEFTSVQGVMGSYYALASGEDETVAQAVADHYRPRFAGDDLPRSQVGQVVAMADKLDTICGLFAVGQAPTGSSDPFALRRSAIGIIAMLEAGLPVPLEDSVDASLRTLASSGISFDEQAIRQEVLDFFITRARVMLRDEGVQADTIDAVLAVGVVEPAEIIARCRALEAIRSTDADSMVDLATAFARANNLRDASLGTKCDSSRFIPVEQSLSSAIDEADEAVKLALGDDDYASALSHLAALRKPIDTFFEDVMIMDEDLEVRANRLKLLNRFVGVFANVADFGLMAKK